MAALKRNSKEKSERERERSEGWMTSFIWSRVTTGCLAAAIVPLLRSRHVKVLAAKPDVLPASLVSPWSRPKRRTTLTSKQIRFLLVRQKKGKKRREKSSSIDRAFDIRAIFIRQFTLEILLKRINELKHERTINSRRRKRKRARFNQTRAMIRNVRGKWKRRHGSRLWNEIRQQR